jgi:23S rRNA pseudouridine2605 synthase
MPRDNDKNNDSRGRRDRPSGGKGRSGAARGPEKKFAKRGFAGNAEGEKRPYAARPEGGKPYEKKPYEKKPYEKKSYEKKPYAGGGKPYAGKRDGDDRPSRGDRPERKDFRPRDDRGGEKRPYTPRGEGRPAPRFQDKKFGDKRPYTPREGGGEKRPYAPRGDRPQGDRPYSARPPRDGDRPHGDRPHGDRPERKFGGDKKFSRGAPDRGPRKDFGSRPSRGKDFGGNRKSDSGDRKSDSGDRKSDSGDRKSGPGDRNRDSGDRGQDRSELKPWQKRDVSSPDHAGRNSRPPREGARNFDKPRFDKPREDRGGAERPRFSRPREDRPQGDRPFRERPKFDRPREGREDRPKFDRPRQRPEGRSDWQEHPRSEPRSDRDERPRRDNEDDSKVFAKRPAFGGRGAYRERAPEERRTARPPREKKSGERIAKVLSRAGLASRRDAEEWIVQGRVSVNGRVINSPALDVTGNDVITIDGKPLPPRERTRLFLFHKPRGLMTTHSDPEGRPTVFDNLPEGLPRLISIGRLDFNTEGLLLLTNDGGLARALELPDTGWLRRYRVRAHGEVTQAQLDELKKGVEVDGVKYGSIDATLERDQGANVWLVFAIREGKNREVRNVMAHLGLEVNRLIRISYGPFQLAELPEGEVEEVKTRVLREQLGEKIAALAGADFNRPMPGEAPAGEGEDEGAPHGKKPFKPAGKNGLIADRKGRRVLVQRTGSEEARARNEAEASGYGPPRRPQRGYHGKRDLKPRDE